MLAHLWLLPASVRLAKVAFALAFGPLLWSVAAFHTPAASEAGDEDYGLHGGGGGGGSDEDGWEALDVGDLFGPRGAELKAQLAARLRARLRLSPRRRSRLVLLRDKLSFLLGSLDLTLSAYCLGAAPAAFAVLYTAKLGALMAARWWLYKRSAQHYYLFDLWWVGGRLFVAEGDCYNLCYDLI